MAIPPSVAAGSTPVCRSGCGGREIGYYHGGDELYWLKGVPGVWHERCLKAAIHEIIPLESHSAGIRLRGAWESVPRWLRVVLSLTFVVVVALISILVKR